ncbi:MAG: YdcF family protein [Patescibacteria group bacterium]
MKFSEWFEKLFETKDDCLATKADVIIAIGTDVSADGWLPSPQSQAIAIKTATLYQNRRADTIIFCGGYATRGLTEAERMWNCVKNRVPFPSGRYTTDGQCFLETKSTRTYMNADNTLAIMKENGWKSAIIVAQQWHARRVRATFWRRWNKRHKFFWRKKCTGPYQIAVVKARSEYTGNNSQSRLGTFWKFFLTWDTPAFILSWLKGWC